MLRFLFSNRAAKAFGALAFLVLLFLSTTFAHAQGQAPIAFVILGPDSPIARVITTDPQCPQITLNGTASAMSVRAAPSTDFPVMVCDAALPPSVTSASVNGQALKLPKAQPQSVVVLGDTGCRLKGDFVQSCNDPVAWPFSKVSDSAASANPDLVIHVGDYHYREGPCVVDKANCAGSPYGDTWAAWNADLFAPGASLLKAAPWVIVPGNHEDCPRAGMGYFLLLDPRPLPATCPQYTDPYAINYMDPQILVFDDASVNDLKVDPAQLATYQKQLQQVNQLAKGTSWMVLHDPMYVFGSLGEKNGKEQLFIDQLTLQQASNNTFPASIQLFISGHVHLFQALSFDPKSGRPPQLVAGNGGTLLDPPITTPLTGLDMAGMKVTFGEMIDKFGYVLMSRGSDGKWALAVKNESGGDMDKCVLGGGALLCGQAALPQNGGDFTWEFQAWMAFALLGAAILLIGMALGVRGLLLSKAN